MNQASFILMENCYFYNTKLKSMNDLLVKYNALPLEGQKEVDDFLDFMLRRHKGKQNFDMKIWKEKIKTVSVWSEEEIKIFDDSKKYFSQWKPEEW
jgi:hypothetical protein